MVSEAVILAIAATLAIVASVAFLCWVIFIRPKQVKELHDKVVDETTREVLEACLAYGQTRLTAAQYETFKDLLTDQINNGEGGMSLARLVEKCIAEAQGEIDEA